MSEIQMRVGIDWTDDGVIEWGVQATDAPNLASGFGSFRLGDTGNYAPTNLSPIGGVIDDETSAVHGHPSAQAVYNASYSYIHWPATGLATGVVPDTTAQISVVNGQSYFVQWWMKTTLTPGGNALIPMYVALHHTGTGAVSAFYTSSQNILQDGKWQLMSMTFTATITATVNLHLRLQVPATTGGLSLSSVMVRAGSATTLRSVFNTGTALGRLEDVTKYLLDVSWEIGTTDVTERMPTDAQATIVLNNDSRLFSPGNPLGIEQYNALKPNKRLVIQLLIPPDVFTAPGTSGVPLIGYYHTMFTGLITEYDPVSGTSDAPTITITASRALNATGDVAVNITPDDLTVSYGEVSSPMEVLERIISQNSIMETFGRVGWRIGGGELGVNTFAASMTSVISPLSDSSYAANLKKVGHFWEDETLITLLRAVVYTEWGWLFVSRDGRLILKGRSAYRGGYSYGTLPVVNADYDATERTYSFGKDIRNTITVDYSDWYHGPANLLPNEMETDDNTENDELLPDRFWSRRANIAKNEQKRLGRRLEQVAYRNVWRDKVWESGDLPLGLGFYQTNDDPHIIREENVTRGGDPDYNMNIIDWDPEKHFIITLRDSLASTMGPYSATQYAYSETFHSLIYDADTPTDPVLPVAINWVKEGNWMLRKGRRLRLYFNNDGSKPNTYTVDPYTIRAVVNLYLGRKTVTFLNEDSIRENKMSYGYSIDKTLLTDAEEATFLAEQVALDYGEVAADNIYNGDITSMTFTATDMHEKAFRFPIYMRCGNVVRVTESYLGLNQEKHLVIGEKFQFIGGVLTAVPTLINVDRFDNV